MSSGWICACCSHCIPSWMWSFFLPRVILQPSISHLSGANQALQCLLKCVLQEERALEKLSEFSQRKIRWWSNDISSYITICSLSFLVFCFLSLTGSLCLVSSVRPGLHPDPVLEVCTTRMRMSAQSTTTWSQQRAAVWPRNPLRFLTHRYVVVLAFCPNELT